MVHKFDPKAIADYLRAYRRFKGHTLAMLASYTGLSVATIYNLEVGKLASLESIYAIACHHGLLMSTIFEFSEAASSVGIDTAYERECPHLIEYRKIRTTYL